VLSCLVVRLSACFFEELEFADDNGGIRGLAHIVESEGGDGGAGESLHLDAGAGGRLGGGGDEEGFVIVRGYFDLGRVEWERVAKRDEVRGLLGAGNAGENGGVEDRALFVLELTVIHLRDEFLADLDEAGRGGDADGFCLGRNIDHARLIGVI